MFKRTKFTDKQLADLIMELVGEIEPVGETNTDNKRFDNLLRVQNTVDILLDEIYYVCEYSRNYEYSMKRAGETAVAWMEEKQKWLNGFLDPESKPKTGHWVKVHGYATPGGDPVWCCSECGKGIHVYGIEHGTYGEDIADGQWVSCPNCSAIMINEVKHL